ncbi:MAG: primosomal protein N', partial [Cyclobacteriaceae bacterium]|nr:primosomal protein N' [Cyclobacteriaceae bacterium]
MSQLEFNTSSPVERSTYFADVILPLAVPKKYTYRIPGMDCEKIEKGFRVIVQFGKRKIFTGIVSKIHEVPPGGYEAKLILAVLDDSPVITPVQLELFDWMAAYYMCTPGEVLQAALPSGLKLSSESKIQIHPVFSIETSEYEFSVEEIDILDIVQNNELMGYSEISDRLNKRNIYQSIKSLIDKNAVIVFEQVSEKFTPKREKRIVLSEKYRKEKSLQLLLNDLGAFEKQENILLGYYQIIKNEKRNLEDSMGVPYSSLTGAEYSKSSLQTLIKKEVFEKFEIIVPRIQIKEGIAKVKLSKEQDEVAGKILQSFEMKKPVLLHGITGSGKTEIYIDLINKVMESGQQVLFLLPEIAITTQMISRLYKAFGNSFGVYHSKYSDNERVEIWNGVLDESIRFVVGVRSSIFLPFQNLGLIIVDEEHETSYKQHQPSPRYHARDVALVLSRLHQCSIILGTATPSTESYFNAEKGKFDLIELNTRYGEAQLPEFKIIDIKTERQKKKTKGEFANLLLELLKSNLENNYQSILFQNRRGYSPILNCDDCGWTAKCVQCSV